MYVQNISIKIILIMYGIISESNRGYYIIEDNII